MNKNPIDSRTRNVMVNTVASGMMKLFSLLCSLVVVPMTIGYLNTENYGVWMAITSILYWIAFCDIGLGNGMRNYMAEAISNNDWAAARSYFSTAVFFLSAIALFLGVISIPVIFFSNLNAVFNTHAIPSAILADTVLVAVIFSLLQFVTKIVGMAYVAMQKYAINDLIVFLGSISSAVIIYILTRTTEGNLIYVVATSTGVPVLFFILAAIPLIRRYPKLKPAISAINLEAAKKVVLKGLGFFTIQITSCLVVFGSANVILSHYCGPEQVTVYNVAYKVFFVLATAYTILISPLWNAYTDAAAKGDYPWIKKTFRRSIGMWWLTVLGGIVLLAISGWIYQLWVGDSVVVPLSVSCCVMVYISLFNLNNCATYLINGLNKIRVQIITSITATVFFLIAISIVKGSYGIVGISACMISAYLIMTVVHLYQSYLILTNKATGIWNK